MAEQQRRIHELESRAEENPEHTTHAAVPVQAPSAPVEESPSYAPAPAPRVEEPRAEPHHVEASRPEPRHEEPQREEPRIDAQQLLHDSGLVMVETDRAKAHSPAAEADQGQPLGRPRPERAQPRSQDEELVQIETRK